MAKIVQVFCIGGNSWIVSFAPRNPVENAMGHGPVIKVKARNYKEAVSKAKKKV